MTTTSAAENNGVDPEAAHVSGFGTSPSDASGSDASAPAAGDLPSTENDPLAAGEDDFELPEGFAGEDGVLDRDKVTEHLKAAKAAEDDRAEKYGQVPEGDYDLSIEAKGADDASISIDPENPFLKGFLADAKELGLGQKAVTGMLTKYAESAVADAQELVKEASTAIVAKLQKAVDTEFQSLGAEGPPRLKAMTGTLTEMVSAEAATAITADIRSRASFEAIEALIEKARGGKENPAPTPGGEHDETDANTLFGNKGN